MAMMTIIMETTSASMTITTTTAMAVVAPLPEPAFSGGPVGVVVATPVPVVTDGDGVPPVAVDIVGVAGGVAILVDVDALGEGVPSVMASVTEVVVVETSPVLVTGGVAVRLDLRAEGVGVPDDSGEGEATASVVDVGAAVAMVTVDVGGCEDTNTKTSVLDRVCDDVIGKVVADDVTTGDDVSKGSRSDDDVD